MIWAPGPIVSNTAADHSWRLGHQTKVELLHLTSFLSFVHGLKHGCQTLARGPNLARRVISFGL